MLKQTTLIFLLLGLGSASAQTALKSGEPSELVVTITINHFQSTASIQFEKEDRNEYICKVYTEDQKLLMKFVKESRKSEYLIPLDHFRAGAYLLSVESKKEKRTYKFIK